VPLPLQDNAHVTTGSGGSTLQHSNDAASPPLSPFSQWTNQHVGITSAPHNDVNHWRPVTSQGLPPSSPEHERAAGLLDGRPWLPRDLQEMEAGAAPGWAAGCALCDPASLLCPAGAGAARLAGLPLPPAVFSYHAQAATAAAAATPTRASRCVQAAVASSARQQQAAELGPGSRHTAASSAPPSPDTVVMIEHAPCLHAAAAGLPTPPPTAACYVVAPGGTTGAASPAASPKRLLSLGSLASSPHGHPKVQRSSGSSSSGGCGGSGGNQATCQHAAAAATAAAHEGALRTWLRLVAACGGNAMAARHVLGQIMGAATGRRQALASATRMEAFAASSAPLALGLGRACRGGLSGHPAGGELCAHAPAVLADDDPRWVWLGG
jgi:hypothetical protein